MPVNNINDASFLTTGGTSELDSGYRTGSTSCDRRTSCRAIRSEGTKPTSTYFLYSRGSLHQEGEGEEV